MPSPNVDVLLKVIGPDGFPANVNGEGGLLGAGNYVWDTNSLSWVRQSIGGGGGPSSDVNVLNFPATYAGTNAASSQADGHSLAIGATGDADTANTVIGRLKQIITRLAGTLTVTGTVTANAGSGTQAVSVASLPLPSGAAQEHTAA